LLKPGWRQTGLLQNEQPEAFVDKSFLQDNQFNPVLDKAEIKAKLDTSR
jgi:hypothetical protein